MVMFGQKNGSKQEISDLGEDEVWSRINWLKNEAGQIHEDDSCDDGEQLCEYYRLLSECYHRLAELEVVDPLEKKYRAKARLWSDSARREKVDSGRLAEELKNGVETGDADGSEDRDEEAVDRVEGQGSDGEDFFEWETPELDFSDVGGQDQLLEDLTKLVIDPVKKPEKHDEYGIPVPNGILFHGPPGTGKTFISKALAGELDRQFLNVSGAELQDRFVGESESNINRLFRQAKMNEPCVVFIDEIDGMIQERGKSNNGNLDQVISQFLRDMPELQGYDALVVASTNRLDMLDDAATRPGRFGKKFELGLPDTQTRFQVLLKLLEDRPVAAGDVDIRRVARLSEGYSCADLEDLVVESCRVALREDVPVMQKHLRSGLELTEPSVNGGDW